MPCGVASGPQAFSPPVARPGLIVAPQGPVRLGFGATSNAGALGAMRAGPLSRFSHNERIPDGEPREQLCPVEEEFKASMQQERDSL